VIKLTQVELKTNLHYCPDTGIFTWLVSNTNSVKVGDIAGSLTAEGYLRIVVNYKEHRAHRLAWLYMYGEFPKCQIDHINGIRNDNRLLNLRDVTNSENGQNRRKAQANNKSSGLLGVTWDKSSNKWKVSIGIDGRQFNIGLFTDKYEAHDAYLNKKREVHPTCTI
jgi:hypothetical protein